MRRTTGTLATTLVLVATLSACGGDPEPRFQEEPSAAPSVTPPSVSAEPEAWEERSPEGAVAFAKHWTATFSEAFQTGETETLTALSAPGCETCTTFISLIRDVYDDGGSIVGDDWELTRAGWVRAEDAYVVTGRMAIPKQTINRAGEKPEPARAIDRRYIFTVTWANGGWRTERLVRQA